MALHRMWVWRVPRGSMQAANSPLTLRCLAALNSMTRSGSVSAGLRIRIFFEGHVKCAADRAFLAYLVGFEEDVRETWLITLDVVLGDFGEVLPAVRFGTFVTFFYFS